MNIFLLIIIILLIILILLYKVNINLKKIAEKQSMYKEYYYITDIWLKIKNNNLSIENYCLNKNIKTIAIYGAGELGTRLYEELLKSKVSIKYITDKKVIDSHSNMVFEKTLIKDISNYKEKNDIDAIIVTPTFYMNQINKYLINLGIKKEIISLEKIISELHNSIENGKEK